jgi:hypothetical protein
MQYIEKLELDDVEWIGMAQDRNRGVYKHHHKLRAA